MPDLTDVVEGDTLLFSFDHVYIAQNLGRFPHKVLMGDMLLFFLVPRVH